MTDPEVNVATPQPGGEPGQRPSGLAGRLRPALRWESGLAVLAVLVGVFGTLSSSQFLTGSNVFNLSVTTGEVAIMALPMTLIIISAEIDLSVASILGMSSALLGVLWSRHWPIFAIFVVVALAGAAAGLLNGLLVTRVGLPSLAVTIGTLGLYRGIALILLGPRTISTFPAPYNTIGVIAAPHTDLPWSVVIFIAAAIVFAVVLHATGLGRSIYAMGASPEAALFAGIRVKRVKTMLFVTSGVMSALAGVLWTFRLDTAVQNNALGLELNVIAVVVFGGVSIFGGRGTIGGVVLALIVFAGLTNALLLTNFNQEATGIVIGTLLLIGVFVPNAGLLAGRARDLLRGRGRARAHAIGARHD
jgi:rhamnose transport system permease protein